MDDELDDEGFHCKQHSVLIRGTSRQGTQGIMDTASKGTMEDEFGTSREEDVVQQILEKGSIIETEVRMESMSHIAIAL